MKKYIVHSTDKPEKVTHDDYHVYVIEGEIKETTIEEEDSSQHHTDYCYEVTEYSKDEYIDKLEESQEEISECLQDLLMDYYS